MRSSEARSSIKLLGRPRFFHNTATAPPPRHNKKSVRIISTSNPSITKTELDLPLSPTHHKWIEVTLKNSSPVFCNAKYRGGVRRTEELKTSAATATNRVSNSPPCRVLSSRGIALKSKQAQKQRQFNRKALISSSAHVCAIGEVSHSDGGVEKESWIKPETGLINSAFIGRQSRKGDGRKRARTV